MDASWPDLAIVALLAFSAAGVQTTIGFGSAVLFTPLATLRIGAQSAVVTSIIMGTLISLALFAEYRPRARVQRILPLALAGTASTPVGLWVLARADETTLRLLLGAAVLAGAITTLFGRTRPEPREGWPPAAVGVGLAAGVMRGATSMGGPPVVLYLHALGGNAATIRGRLFAFFAIFALPGIPLAWLGGVITQREVEQALVAMPAVALGIVAGRHARLRVSESWFRRLSMGLLMLTSAVAITGALSAVS